jgi:hypothetical protein
MQASVPELQKRTLATPGTSSFTRAASRTSSGLGMPKLVPCAAAACTAAMIRGGAWPRIAGPHVPT